MEASRALPCSPSGHFEHCHLWKCQWHHQIYQLVCQSSATWEPSALNCGSQSHIEFFFLGGGSVTEYKICKSIGNNKRLLKVQWWRSIQNQVHNSRLFLEVLTHVAPCVITGTLCLSHNPCTSHWACCRCQWTLPKATGLRFQTTVRYELQCFYCIPKFFALIGT